MLKEVGIYVDTKKEYPFVRNYIYEGNEQDFGILKHYGRRNLKIYQDRENPTIGYRLYQNNAFNLSSYHHWEEALLLQKMYEYGQSVCLTEFPKGVVTYNGRIIGQVIPYYDNSFELGKVLKNSNYQQINPYTLLLKAYAIIQELYNHGILYYDIHSSNFVVNSEGVHLIDFEASEIYFLKEIVCQDTLIQNMIYWFMAIANNNIRYPYAPEDILPNYLKVDSLPNLYNELKNGETLVLKKY